MRRAAALMIGNELLYGKITDANVAPLARFLGDKGIALDRVLFIRDEAEVIATEVRNLSAGYDYVFTSGGIGPTHDDKTVESIAFAFGTTVTHDPRVLNQMKDYLGTRFHPNHQRLALVPSGGLNLYGKTSPWPVISFKNIFILPGVPSIFLSKLQILDEHIPNGTVRLSYAVDTTCDEVDIADQLTALQARFPSIELGSYPNFDGERRVRLTLDGYDLELLETALAQLLEFIPPAALIGTLKK